MVDDRGVRIVDAATYSVAATTVHLAMQSGPLLVIGGQINPQFSSSSTSRRIRSGVGVVDPQRVVFLISRQPVTFYDFAVVFRDTLKCRDALYLDGEISTFYSPTADSRDGPHDYAGILGATERR